MNTENKNNSHLYFANGKAKKQYCKCLDKSYQAELRRINGPIPGITCAGLRCPFYSIGCGRSNIEKFNKETKGENNDK